MPTRGIVGRPLGTISARAPGSVVYNPAGQGYDFAIGGLPFHCAITDERKYERATADFRKEQFDSARSVGEQSLTGWWLRSQLSFHRGAGLKFYDLNEGEEQSLNRFQESEGLDVSVPGEVTLVRDAPTINNTHLLSGAAQVVSRAAPLAGVSNGNEGVEINGGTTTIFSTVVAATPVWMVTSAGVADTFFATSEGIEKVPAAGTALTSVWTHTVGANTFRGVWWAKNRLFGVDSGGHWWAVAKSPGGVLDDTNAFWKSGISSANHTWSLVDTPSSVFVSFQNRVYAVTLDANGAVPVLAGGIVAAELPNDEDIIDMAFGAGVLVLCTTKGVRAAVVDGERIAYGPLIVRGSALSATMQGTRALVGMEADNPDGESVHGVVAIDLAQQVTDLVYAWAVLYTNGVTSPAVALTEPGEGVYILSSLGVRQAGESDLDPLVASGSLATGFLRFGTLEPKHFHAVKVRVSGSGTVTVLRVMRDGSEVSVYTVSATSSLDEDITLGLTNTEEYIGLKFVLTRDAADTTLGPTLLGYQLRALPAPVRQRLIRIPLSLYDVERGPGGRARGHEGQAAERLFSLEAKEQEGGLHLFQDFRTGEAGLAQIERIEVENHTAPSSRSDGFGGVVWLTLRKV